MADDIEVKLNGAGFRTIMKSAGVGRLLGQSVKQMESAAEAMSGKNYLSNVQIGRASAHGLVGTADRAARAHDAQHNTLRKCIDAGRI